MHQHPRPPPVTASPASSERTNPERTNNQRDRDTPPPENFSRQPQDRTDGSDESNSSPILAAEVTRLNQVIQVGFAEHSNNRASLIKFSELSHQSRSHHPALEI